MNAEEEKEETPKKGKSALTKKIIKIMTVIAYASGVSSAGFLLSLYYIIFWDPQITGVRPPGYLQAGQMVGLPQALMVDQPQALLTSNLVVFKKDKPSSYPHKVSKEFMDILFKNFTGEEIAAASDLREGQPTPKVLPVFKDGYDGAPAAHFTPTQPLPAHRFESSQVVNTDAILGHSLHQSHRSTREHQQHEQQQQRHYQMQRHQQQHLQQQHQQEAYTALA
nr:uncharacterized protein LOC128687687 [Cherax quadricarinatus]